MSALREIGPQQPHAAVDVVAHTARRDDAADCGVGGAHAADAEAVAPVDVGHGEAGHLDAGEAGDIGHLLGGSIAAQLGDHPLVGEDQAVDEHARLIAFRNPPRAFVEPLERALKRTVRRLFGDRVDHTVISSGGGGPAAFTSTSKAQKSIRRSSKAAWSSLTQSKSNQTGSVPATSSRSVWTGRICERSPVMISKIPRAASAMSRLRDGAVIRRPRSAAWSKSSCIQGETFGIHGKGTGR